MLESLFRDRSKEYLSKKNDFCKKVDDLLEVAQYQEDYLFAIFSIQLDYFDLITNQLGFEIAENFILEINQRLKSVLSVNDKIARFKSNSIFVLITQINSIDEALKIAQKIKNELIKSFQIKEKSIYTSVSIGIATCQHQEKTGEQILKNAELAMYQASQSTPSKFLVFTPELRLQAWEKLQFENDFRKALKQQQFLLYYQPIIELSTQKIISLEALIRWQSTNNHLISPIKIIEVAEQTGLIVPISWWVMRQACFQINNWRQNNYLPPDFTVSLNIHPQQLIEIDFESKVKHILLETNVPPQYLVLEISENTSLNDLQAVINALKALKKLGIKITLDNFGTAYSSLSYLNYLPIDYLKLDSSFIQGIDLQPHKLELIKAVTNSVANLGIKVIAKGIETTEQLVQLQETHCYYGQGYFISAPVNPEIAISMISTNKFKSGIKT
ncbi:response regulator receiver modulated diguanylate cyclase/phosphodiesterase with PAS/PAC sensor [Stanieria sp. NIES-3757]|nr:response regulator receiver modulated diguanylate cyclase/phosphodiesterase with PAS/PAC sensor [Stanieria sp. NIES-3757]